MNNLNESNIEQDDTLLDWANVDWKIVRSYVERLQGRIYTATDKKDFRKVKNLQKLAIRSHYVKLYAIRQVTQINSGKYTPGIDGVICISNREREKLYNKVQSFSFSSIKSYRPLAVRRVKIPKGNSKYRPIGIPTIYDRVIQMLIKIAMEPEWERKFHANSFGFRPGRCCQDAVEKIKKTIWRGRGEYILNADITGCFDNISHSSLLSNLHLFKPIIRKWLEAGVIVENNLYKTVKGTPQGGIISPLLMNIALNGLDHSFNKMVLYHGKKFALTCVRYADDIVILTRNRSLLKRIEEILSDRLFNLGLTLNTEKTSLVHKSVGFKFLGFHFIQHVRRTLWIQPEKSSINRILRELKQLIDINRQAKTDALIYALNKKIVGWAHYYQYCRNHKIFARMDSILYRWVWKWCTRRHPRKSRKWIRNRYFKAIGQSKWVLSGNMWFLKHFTDIRRKKYKWIVGGRSYLNPLERESWKRHKI